MARIARVVVPGIPHHVTQRGNRRMDTFFAEDDYNKYLSLMAEWCNRFDVEVWAYCLMRNHVHLIVIPKTGDALRRAIGEAHRRYTRHVNFRNNWKGHLWQGRFASFPMDEKHLVAAARYVEQNPVKAGLVKRAKDYPWSSALSHLQGKDDILVKAEPLLQMIPNWDELLSETCADKEYDSIRRHEKTGRPLGDEGFISRLEQATGRRLRRRKPGPKKK